MQHILNKSLIAILIFLTSSAFSEEKQKWERFTIGIFNDSMIEIQASPLTLTRERELKWDGDIEPIVSISVRRPPSFITYHGRISLETYKYASDLIRNAPHRKIGFDALEHNNPDKGIIFLHYNSGGFAHSDKEGYITKEKFIVVMEMLLNDLEVCGDFAPTLRADVSKVREILTSRVERYSKNISRATLGYGDLQMKIFEKFICLQRANENLTLNAVLQEDGDFKDLLLYLKANSLSCASNTHRDAKSVGVKVESQNSVREYFFETPYVWEYVMSIISSPGDAANGDNTSFPKYIMQSSIPNIPSEFKGKVETPEQAENIALKAFARHYKDPFNPISAKPIHAPVKFAHRIVKLEDTVNRFGSAGAKIWQVEMFDENGALICVAWINPENDESLLKSPDNIAKDVNAETVKFILEPAQMRNPALPLGNLKSSLDKSFNWLHLTEDVEGHGIKVGD